jgi:hypothetical protein
MYATPVVAQLHRDYSNTTLRGSIANHLPVLTPPHKHSTVREQDLDWMVVIAVLMSCDGKDRCITTQPSTYPIFSCP